eukprot:RCo001762
MHGHHADFWILPKSGVFHCSWGIVPIILGKVVHKILNLGSRADLSGAQAEVVGNQLDPRVGLQVFLCCQHPVLPVAARPKQGVGVLLRLQPRRGEAVPCLSRAPLASHCRQTFWVRPTGRHPRGGGVAVQREHGVHGRPRRQGVHPRAVEVDVIAQEQQGLAQGGGVRGKSAGIRLPGLVEGGKALRRGGVQESHQPLGGVLVEGVSVPEVQLLQHKLAAVDVGLEVSIRNGVRERGGDISEEFWRAEQLQDFHRAVPICHQDIASDTQQTEVQHIIAAIGRGDVAQEGVGVVRKIVHPCLVKCRVKLHHVRHASLIRALQQGCNQGYNGDPKDLLSLCSGFVLRADHDIRIHPRPDDRVVSQRVQVQVCAEKGALHCTDVYPSLIQSDHLTLVSVPQHRVR